MIRGVKLGLAAGIALGVLAGSAAPSLAHDAAAAIALRQAVMKSMAVHLGSIKAALATRDAKVIGMNAAAVAALAPNLPGLFPKGSGPGAGKTRAKAKIWSDWDNFKGHANTLATEAATLAKVAKTNDMKQIVAQFAKTAKMGCGGCHGTFREKKQ